MKQAVAFDPENEEAWYGLGRCYYTQSAFPNAEQAFVRALALDPKDVKAATNLALTLEMRNLSKDADRQYRKAIAMADAAALRAGARLPRSGHDGQGQGGVGHDCQALRNQGFNRAEVIAGARSPR
jgi:tetratricopeptide (TPR) repeat protein